MNLVRLLLGLLPPNRLKNALLSRAGRDWSVHPGARVGMTVIWNVERLTIGDRALVGTGNVLRDLRSVTIGEDAYLGQLNWVSGTGVWADPGQPLGATLEMAPGSGVMSRHHLDCAGGIVLGEMSLISGLRSAVLTHDMDVMTSRMRLGTVRIGSHCLIGSFALLQRGVTITDRCVVGGGAVVTRDLTEPETFYVGAPATAKRSLVGAAFFTRTDAHLTPEDLAEVLS